MAVVAIGGMLLASFLEKAPPMPCWLLAGVHSGPPCARRAGPGWKHASEASSCPVPSLLTDVFKNGLLGLVCAGFPCHQLSKFCFNLTWRPAGDPRGSVWLDFWLYACPLWRVSGARLVFSVVPLQAVFLHFSSLFINQCLILTLFLPSLC